MREVGLVEVKQNFLETIELFEPKQTLFNVLQLRIVAKARDGRFRDVMKVNVWPDPRNPAQMVVEGLRIESPLEVGGQLSHSQNKKGVPSTVFRFAQSQLFRMANRKLVGMQPASDEAQRTMTHLDELFEYAKRSLPEKYRAGSADDFSRMLGDPVTKDPYDYPALLLSGRLGLRKPLD